MSKHSKHITKLNSKSYSYKRVFMRMKLLVYYLAMKPFKKLLIDEFPHLFKNESMIEIDEPGWYELIRKFALTVNDSNLIDKEELFLKVREKSGLLRISLPTAMLDNSNLSYKIYTEMSRSICYRCGSPGTYYSAVNSGWAHVYCEKCESDYLDGQSRAAS